MTREQQRQAKEARKQAANTVRIEKRQDKQDKRNWDKMVIRAKAKGAWIEP